MNYGKLIKMFAVASCAGLAFPSHAATLQNWDRGVEYTTKMSFTADFTDVRAEQWTGTDIHYCGEVSYDISRSEDTEAKLNFIRSALLQVKTPPSFVLPKESKWVPVWWENLMAPKGVTVSSGEVSVLLDEDKTKEIFGLDAFSDDMKKAFAGTYLLKWTTQRDAGSFDVLKNPEPGREGDVPERAPDGVRDFMKCAVNFNYDALCEGRAGREYWEIDADNLSGMIPQNMLHGARLEGRVCLQWKEIGPEERNADPTLKDSVDARIQIVQRHGNKETKLKLFFEAVRKDEKAESEDRKKQRIEIPANGVAGYFLIDKGRRAVRFGKIRLLKAKYSGDMLKIGDVDHAPEKIDADVKAEFEYTQEINPNKNQ